MENGGISLATLLRVKAEKILKTKSPHEISNPEDADVLKLLHELEVYGVELEMQNDELMVANLNTEEITQKNKFSEEVKQRIIYEFELNQIEKEIQNEELLLSNIVSQDVSERYSDLFNFSSTGYLILTRDGEILDLNYSSARLLGKDRYILKNSRLGFFVSEGDRPVFNSFLEEIFKDKVRVARELNIIPYESLPITVLLTGIMTQNKDQCLLTLIDITEHKQQLKNKELTREVLQLLNDPRDFNELVHHMLSAIKERMGIDAVAIRLQQGDDFPYLDQIGFSPEFVQAENSLIEVDATGKVYCDKKRNPRLACSCGLVLSGRISNSTPHGTPGGSWWTNNSTAVLNIPAGQDQRFHPRNRCIYQGYASIALVPVRDKSQILGMIQLIDHHSNMFSLSKIEFLEGISSHIGAALLRKQAEHKLRENELLLRTITENAPDIIIQIDRDGTIQYMNRALPGDSVKNNLGKNFCHGTLPEYHDLMNQALKSVFQDSTTHTFLTRGNDARGELRWFRTYISPVKEKETVKKAILITRDITEAKLTEEILRKREEKLNTLIMRALDGFWIADLEGQIMEVNNAFCLISGYSREELLSMHIQDLDDADSREAINLRIQQVMEAGEGHFENRHRRKDGSLIYVEANVQFSPINGGQFITFFHDVTSRKHDEELLRQSEERYRSFFQDNHSVMLLLDPDSGAIVDANPEASRYYGWSIEELCRKNISEIDPLPKEVTAQKLQESKVHKNNHLFLKHRLASGELRDVEVYSGPLQFGNVVLLYSIVHDITEKIQVEEALQRSKDNLRAILDTTKESIFMLNTDGEIVDANTTAALRMQLILPDLIGKKYKDFLPVENRQKRLSYLQEVFTTGKSVHFEDELQNSILEHDFSPVFNHGEVEHVVCFSRDITSQKKAHEVIQASERRLSEIYASMSEGLAVHELVFDESGNAIDYLITEANPAYETITGQRRSEILRKKATDLYSLEKAPYLDVYSAVERTGVPNAFEAHFLPQNKHFLISVFSPGKGKFVTVFRDITEQRIAQEAQQTSERRMEAVFNGVTETIMLLDMEGTILVANQTAASRFRMPVDELVGKNLFALESADTRNRRIEQVLEMMRTGAPIRFEDTQGILSVDSTFYPIQEPSGEINQFIVFNHDITARKQAQEALRVNEERYSLIYNSSRDGVFCVDMDGKITSANRSFCDDLHLEQSKVVGCTLAEVGLPEYLNRELESWERKALETNNSVLSEVKLPLGNGSIRYYEVILNPLHEDNDTIVGFGVSTRNITKRKEATLALFESEKRFRYLVKEMPVGVILYGPNSEVLMSNPKAMELLGMSPEKQQLIFPFSDGWSLIHEDGTPFAHSEHPVFRAFDACRPVHNVILGALRADSTEIIWLLMNVEVILKGDRSIRNAICSFIDITRQKKIETELRESEEKFRNLVWDMQVGVFLTDPDSSIIMSNPKAMEFLGLAENQLMGRTAYDPEWQAIHEDGSPFPGEDHPSVKAIATGRPIRDVIMGVFHPLLMKHVWLLIDAVPKFNYSGELQNVLVTFIDVTMLKNTQNELKQSEQRLKYHFENSPLAVVEWDKDYIVTQWSIEAEHMFGWKKEEAIGKKLETLNLIYEEDIPFVYYTLEKLTTGNEDTIVSYTRNFTKFGAVIDCTWYNSILLDENGKMSSVMALILDITSRKESENALKKLNEELEDRVKERTIELSKLNEDLKIAQDKYRTVSDFATNWEFWIDPVDRMIYCSPSCERITGYTSSEFEENSQLIFDIIHPEDLPLFQEHKKQELQPIGCEHEFKYRILKKDGTVRWIGHFCRSVYDELGNFRGIRGSNKDITARIKMEELLTTSNQKYKLLSENINDGIFICKQGKFEYVNNALSEMFGYEVHELEGSRLTTLVNTDYLEELENFLYTDFPENQSCNLEVECLKRDSSAVFIEILLNYSSKGKIVYGVMHDITEKKQLQKNMLKAIIQTEEKERAHFSKELHDGLGPLLSTIKLYLQWSERPNSNNSRDEIIGKAGEILEEALATVKEISNKLSPHLLINYGLNSAIKSFVEKLNATATYNIVFESNAVRRIDVEIEAALYRAIIECINNTVKYAQANNIYIKLNDSGAQIQLQYKDDGLGFDLNEALSRQKGLGLFNLQNRIHTIGGKVELFSEPGKGVYYLFTVNA